MDRKTPEPSGTEPAGATDAEARDSHKHGPPPLPEAGAAGDGADAVTDVQEAELSDVAAQRKPPVAPEPRRSPMMMVVLAVFVAGSIGGAWFGISYARRGTARRLLNPDAPVISTVFEHAAPPAPTRPMAVFDLAEVPVPADSASAGPAPSASAPR